MCPYICTHGPLPAISPLLCCVSCFLYSKARIMSPSFGAWSGVRKPSTSSSRASTAATVRRDRPVIIYIDKPKVIHTSASNFMALVQKLTGPPDDDVMGFHPR